MSLRPLVGGPDILHDCHQGKICVILKWDDTTWLLRDFIRDAEPGIHSMHEYRTVEPIDEMPAEYLDSGHFWVQEYVTGRILRFQMESSGLLTFGGPDSIFEPEEIPVYFRRAVETVRAEFDRGRLREGTESVGSYTFYGVATLAGETQYDWSDMPAFLGLDIWDGSTEEFASEDVAERVFEAVGLETAPFLKKEVPARSFNPATYSMPTATWGEGPAPGVLLRKKNGLPALLTGTSPSREPWELPEASDTSQSLDAWVESRITGEVIDTLIRDLGIDPEKTPVDEMASDIAAELARRNFDTLGPIIESSSNRFETAVHERIRSLNGVA